MKRKSSFTYKSFCVCSIEMSGPTFKLNFFIFLNRQQNKHCLEARSPGGKSNVQRSHFFLFLMLFVYHIFLAALESLVLLGLKLLLPGLIQVYQPLVVENKENEVQCICGDADDAEVL